MNQQDIDLLWELKRTIDMCKLHGIDAAVAPHLSAKQRGNEICQYFESNGWTPEQVGNEIKNLMK